MSQRDIRVGLVVDVMEWQTCNADDRLSGYIKQGEATVLRVNPRSATVRFNGGNRAVVEWGFGGCGPQMLRPVTAMASIA